MQNSKFRNVESIQPQNWFIVNLFSRNQGSLLVILAIVVHHRLYYTSSHWRSQQLVKYAPALPQIFKNVTSWLFWECKILACPMFLRLRFIASVENKARRYAEGDCCRRHHVTLYSSFTQRTGRDLKVGRLR